MENKNNILNTALLAGIFVMLAYLIFIEKNINVEMINTKGEEKTIAVSAQAEKFIKPDTASLNFSLLKKSSSVATATDSINKRSQSLIKALKKLGVQEKDIKTINYNIYPEYFYNEGKKKFDGYRVTQQFKVIIRDLDKASQILSLINNSEVDNVSQLNFYIDKTDEIKNNLRKEAIKKAKEKARQLSRDLGVSLNKIVGFQTNKGGPFYQEAKAMTWDASKVEGNNKKSEPILPSGENKFQEKVTIIYKIDN